MGLIWIKTDGVYQKAFFRVRSRTSRGKHAKMIYIKYYISKFFRSFKKRKNKDKDRFIY